MPYLARENAFGLDKKIVEFALAVDLEVTAPSVGDRCGKPAAILQ